MSPNRSRFIQVRKLLLHPENPRLPERLVGAGQEAILKYLHANAALDELGKSFLDNGFFSHEPLIVSKPDHLGFHTVFEGNRRLAALTILLQLDPAVAIDAAFSLDPDPSDEQLEQLAEVPCYLVDSAEEVHRFLGFRHIGGLKTWSAEAKARYLQAEVNRNYDRYPAEDPFVAVARSVGSNAQGIRNPFIAISILMKARDDFGIEISAVQNTRFGVWNRAMNSPDLRHYIGFGDARSFDEVCEGLERLEEDRLREVLGDMTPEGDSNRAVLGDSRDVTIYAQVLMNERAHAVLRQYNSLELARQIVQQASIPQRISTLGQSVELLNREVEREGAPESALQPAKELARLARALVALVSLDAENHG